MIGIYTRKKKKKSRRQCRVSFLNTCRQGTNSWAEAVASNRSTQGRATTTSFFFLSFWHLRRRLLIQCQKQQESSNGFRVYINYQPQTDWFSSSFSPFYLIQNEIVPHTQKKDIAKQTIPKRKVSASFWYSWASSQSLFCAQHITSSIISFRRTKKKMKPPFLSLSKNITKKNIQWEREQCCSSILHPPPFSFSPAGIYTLSLSHLVFFSLSMCIERSLLDLINNSCRPKVPVQYNSLSLGPHRIDFLVRFFLSVTFFFYFKWQRGTWKTFFFSSRLKHLFLLLSNQRRSS